MVLDGGVDEGVLGEGAVFFTLDFDEEEFVGVLLDEG